MHVVTEIISEIVRLWNEMALFLLFGFIAAGVLSRAMSPATVAAHMGGASWWSITKAALLGIPLPLCSCGVIPTGLWLRDHGASRGATSAFLISTPQTGIDSLAVTYSFLGILFALFRPLAALVSGLFGGILVAKITSRKNEPAGEQDAASCPHCQAEATAAQANAASESEHLDQQPGPAQNLSLWKNIKLAAHYGLVKIPKDMGLWLFIGVAAAGVAAWGIPDNFFEQHLQSNIVTMLLMIAVGTPLYICSSASVPIAAVLVIKGLSPGAVFVFLMAGPATNVAALAILCRVLGLRATIVQTLSIMLSALACGLALDWLFNLVYHGQGLARLQQIVQDSSVTPHLHSALGLTQIASSIALLLVVLNALRLLWLERRRKHATCCHQNQV